MKTGRFFLALAAASGCAATRLVAQPFQLPTANRALFEKGGEERFFVGTVGKPWTSGCFGCVRSDGWQMHEGLDIRCLQRDKRGEPTNYIILRHSVDGLEIYSTYAHLREIRSDLRVGQAVKTGETIAIMGHTANTHEGISKERAHVHFELNLFINDRFPAWYKKMFPGQRNDHGAWNGQNLVGFDPRQVLLEEHSLGAKFNLLQVIRSQTELCRVVVRTTNFPWLKRYAALVRSNPRAEKEGVAGYEIALNFNALAFELVPRAASEIKGKAKFQLLSVNQAEQQRNPCRRLVTKRGARWELTSRGLNALELLTY
ncbi:MAG: hypothetical protein DME26_10780 [Verrucomicrobia bacterium]|nr:MAG: hypothetical protein DME26_10780 [Verrucomicrobiota bacterium]